MLIKKIDILTVYLKMYSYYKKQETRIFCELINEIAHTTVTLKNGLMTMILSNSEI